MTFAKHLELLKSSITQEEWENKETPYVGYNPTSEAVIGGGTNVIYNPPPMPLVDLGLPSGTLWAKYNLGATSETDYGLYFQWADTEGYTADQVGPTAEGKKYFANDWSDYKWWNPNVTPEFEDIPEDELVNSHRLFSGSNMRLTQESVNAGLTKYTGPTEKGGDGKLVVESSDDAATQMLGSKYKMPTQTQWEELFAFDETSGTYTNVNIDFSHMTEQPGSYIKISNKSDASKYIILPAAGYARNGQVNLLGSYGYFWSSSLYSSYVQNAYLGSFSKSTASVLNSRRYQGFSVRCVGA